MISDSQVDNLTLETLPASCKEEMGWKQVNNSVGEQLNGGSNIDGLIEALISRTLLSKFKKKVLTGLPRWIKRWGRYGI